jgi:predicted GNAT family N-acyltransferase
MDSRLSETPEKPETFTVRSVDWQLGDSDPAREIRMRVFVDEQKVPADLELDDIDATAVHVVAYDPAGRACGTGRLFHELDSPTVGHIGRMAVLPEVRGCGCGAAILQSLLAAARATGYQKVVLSAQTHATGFYEKHGFRCTGEVYLDAGIPHRMMELAL